MDVRIRIDGLQEIGAALRELPRRLDSKILNAGLLAGARVVRDEAKRLAPELSVEDDRWERGALRRAIAASRIRPTQYAAEATVRVRKLTKRQLAKFKSRRRFLAGRLRRAHPRDAFYWVFVEFGTAKMTARPFLRPAFESQKERAVEAAIKVFRDRLEKEMVKAGRTLH